MAGLGHVTLWSYVTCERTQAGRAEDFKTRFPGRRRIQGNIRCGGDTRIALRRYGDVQNESIWQLKSETAGAMGGAREGRPRHSRIFPVASDG